MLTDTACKNAHKNEKTKLNKPFTLSDEKGLSFLLKPLGSGWGKWWRFRYRIAGKEKSISFGTYPEVSLELARQRRDDARKLVAEGVDPSAKRRSDKVTSTNTLNAIAKEWLKDKCLDNDPHRPRLQLSYILPVLG